MRLKKARSIFVPRYEVITLVQSLTFENFLKKNNIQEIDILKCDIEGSEFLVFENNFEILLKAKTIIFELHIRDNIIPEKTELFKYICKNFETKYNYTSSSHGNKYIELFGTRKDS